MSRKTPDDEGRQGAARIPKTVNVRQERPPDTLVRAGTQGQARAVEEGESERKGKSTLGASLTVRGKRHLLRALLLLQLLLSDSTPIASCPGCEASS
ncbi:hypothetical protein CCHR01_18727 [Colletotrichum chrysophilum]|uniref:Uncharacterized protein n=1 Tax=Colletotrichum chrysophilum TaxID=1836956 RepID=A0AAD9A139_9PEZI|nr:hypothetical protein CCHR01_18727 [Colletotrichum chrysophilum]